MNKLITIVIVVAVIVGSGAFYGGMKYAESKNSQQRIQALVTNAGGFRNKTGVQQRNGSANGEIIAKDDKSVTIKLRDGGSKIVFFADSTKIAKSVSGTLNNLEVGKSVIINGKANQDGSITAESISIAF